MALTPHTVLFAPYTVEGERWNHPITYTDFPPTTKSDGIRTLYICAPEDIVLHKLLWYAAGSGVSDRQWYDLQGVLRLQAYGLDLAYLRYWATVLGVGELLHR